MSISLHAPGPEEYIDCKTFQERTHLSARLWWKKIQEEVLVAYRPSPRRTLVKWSNVQQWIEASKAPSNLSSTLTTGQAVALRQSEASGYGATVSWVDKYRQLSLRGG